MPCERAHDDPHWCRAHRADFSEEADHCEVVLGAQAVKYKRVTAILHLLGAIGLHEEERARALGGYVWSLYGPDGAG